MALQEIAEDSLLAIADEHFWHELCKIWVRLCGFHHPVSMFEVLHGDAGSAHFE